MTGRTGRSRWEEGALDLSALTPGQRYTSLVVAVLAVVVLTTGMPDGKLDASTGVGSIPDLAAGIEPQRELVAANEELPGIGPSPSSLDTALAPAPESEPAATTPFEESTTPGGGFSFDEEEGGGTEDPEPTTTTTQPPAPSPIPLPAPLPTTPLGGSL